MKNINNYKNLSNMNYKCSHLNIRPKAMYEEKFNIYILSEYNFHLRKLSNI